MKKRLLSSFMALFLTVGTVFGGAFSADVVYAAEGSVSGTVLDTAGKAKSGANIVLRDKNDSATTYTAISGDDGTYTITGVPAGTYQATAYETNFYDSNAVVQTVTVGEEAVSDVDLQFPVDLTSQMTYPGFAETKNDLTGWSNSLSQTAGAGGFRSESKASTGWAGGVAFTPWASSAYQIDMYQTISNLKNGTYVVSCSATCGWGDGSSVSLYAKNAEGTIISSEALPNGNTWQAIGLVAEVTDGTLTIGIASDGDVAANGWGNIDEFHVGLLAEPAEEEEEEVIDADYINDQFWKDTDGNTIYSQGGGIFKFDDTYYWYGVKYEEAVAYAENPRKYYSSSDIFVGITCYSSKDLKNWTYEGLVAEPEDVYNEEIMGTTKPYSINNGKTTWLDGDEVKNSAVWVGRLGVTKLEDGTYALLVQHECADYTNGIDGDTDQWSKQVLVMTADSPNGHFTWNNRINMKSAIGTTNTGDQTVFVDDDGTGWLVYSYGSGRGKMYLSKIEWNEDTTKVVLGDPYMVYSGEGREGNCMFKYDGKYYLCASDLYGWNASHGYYMTIDPGEMTLEKYLKSDSFKPATSLELMDGTSDDFCHVSQTGFFYTVQGSGQTTVIFCGDRWADFAGNGLGYNQWCPLSFDAEGTPYFNSLSAWNMDVATGEWTVADGNNYVKNGSFEADRVAVEEIAGWKQVTNKGANAVANNVAIGDATVTGKGSLKIGSASAYDVEVSQTITSSEYVELEDGVYKMTAKVKNSGKFDNLQMYAVSGDKKTATSFASANPVWTTVKVENIVVEDNKVEIGFLAAGEENSECIIDDVTFTKVENSALAEGSITGAVSGDAANAGKVLTITAENGTSSYSVSMKLTASEQTYTIANLPAGTYTVSFAAQNCIVPDAITVTVEGGSPTSVETQTITNNAGTVSGKVITEDKSGLEGVTITLSKDGSDDIIAVTGEDGTYELTDVEVGTYKITFVKRGYISEDSAAATAEVTLNTTSTISDVTMIRNAGTVAGKVVNSCGIAVSGAVVTLRDKSDNTMLYTATTDENGAYTIEDVVQGSYVATATTKTVESDAWQELNAGNNNIVVEPNEETNGDLQFGIDLTSKIVNPTFDNDLSGWTNGASTTGGYRLGKQNTHGTYQLAPWSNSAFTMDTYQTITGLENGTYIVTCWSNSAYKADSDKLELYAKDGSGRELARESVQADGSYKTIALLAEVTDGTLTIGVDGGLAASSWANIDDFHLGLLGKYHANAERHEAAEASCGADGHENYWSCPDCGKFFKDADGVMDTSVAYDEVSEVTTVVPATGNHKYGEPAFTWSKDYTTCTAVFTCINCGEEVTENCTVTSEQTEAPTCTKEGTTAYTATVTFEEQSYTDTKTAAIAKTEHNYVTTTEADGTIVESCSVCGEVKSRTPGQNDSGQNDSEQKDPAQTDPAQTDPAQNNPAGDNPQAVQVAGVTLAKTVYTYTGKAIKPAVTAKDTAGNVIDAGNYTVAYSANKNVGTATVKVTFTGNYSGTYSLSFTINPKSTSISKATASSKGFKLKWKKQTTQVTGYEIRYSTNKNFKSAKNAVVKKAKTTSKTFSKLKAKKKYYVQIRTYKTVGGKKYYSSWSKAKTVTTKK